MKGNVHLTEIRLSRTQIWCVADNHYVSRMGKGIFRFELSLSSY